MVLDVWLDLSGAAVAATVGAGRARVDRPGGRPRGGGAASPSPSSGTSWLGPRLRVWRREAREATAPGHRLHRRHVRRRARRPVGRGRGRRRAGASPQLNAAAGPGRPARPGRDPSSCGRSATAPARWRPAWPSWSSRRTFRRGDLSVGDLGLFVTYAAMIAELPKWIGRYLVVQRQADVSVDRLAELLVTARPPGRRGADADVAAPRSPAARAAVLAVRVGAPDDRRGRRRRPRARGDPARRRDRAPPRVAARHHRRRPGGAARRAGGRHRARRVAGRRRCCGPCSAWSAPRRRHDPLERRAGRRPVAVLVPPRAAYLPQVPRLFSEPLADTILLGEPADDLDARPVAHLPRRGPGVDARRCRPRSSARGACGCPAARSSGRARRAPSCAGPSCWSSTTCRAPSTSTPRPALWDRVAGGGFATALLVSHRPHVLERADRVVVLDEGRVVEVA